MELINNIDFKDLLNLFVDIRSPFGVFKALIDVGIVSYVVYKLVFLMRETRAWQLIKGIIFIIIVAQVSEYLGLNTIAFILNNTTQYIVLTIIIIFQPELRRGLEQIGRSKFSRFVNFDEDDLVTNQTDSMIEAIVKASSEFSRTCTGALIVIEMKTKMGDIINTGVIIDSKVSLELMMNIFTPNTPLHDGAIIIRNNKIRAASCVLPLTENPNLSKELGTRHRAALGVTEVSDAISVVVSEETGVISFALNGILTRNLTTEKLKKVLSENIIKNKLPTKKRNIWKVKPK